MKADMDRIVAFAAGSDEFAFNPVRSTIGNGNRLNAELAGGPIEEICLAIGIECN